MVGLALDTHRTVKRLIEAGFSSKQVETVTDMLRETRASEFSVLATKVDLQVLQAELRTTETNLKADIRTVEASLKADIRTVEASLTARIADGNRATLQWVVGLFLAQTAVIAGLLRMLAGH